VSRPVRISANPGRLLAVVVALSILLASCTTGTPSRSATATSAAAEAPPPPAELCGGPTTPAQSFWLSAPGGAQIYAGAVGTGPTTAVFVHQAGTTGLCGFWPYADWLARTKGVRSLLFSQCGNGASQCPAGNPADQWPATTTAAVTWARAHGAGPLTLVGASAGGAVVLQVAASIRPQVDAVVDLSGEGRWQGLDSLAAARRLQVPALFAVAPGDRYVSVGTMRRLYQAAPVHDKRLVVLAEGAGHGWELLGGAAGSDWSPLAVTVAAWIQGSPPLNQPTRDRELGAGRLLRPGP
jgi:pimeloyl-ACP methyl ester carboxylesterase